MKSVGKNSARHCFLLLFLAAFFILPAGAERLPVKIYTSADGLGSSFVDYVMRDSRGFMWFATRDGVSRFDGSRFITYQIGEKNTPPGIEMLYEDRQGFYWIATTGGMYRFNPGNLTTNDFTPGGNPKLNAEFISDKRGFLFEDSKGNFWMGETALFRVIERDGKVAFEEVPLNLPPMKDRGFLIAVICEGADGSLWINSSWGLIRRLPDGRIIYYPREAILTEGVMYFMLDDAGNAWISSGVQLMVMKPETLDELADLPSLTVRELKPSKIVPVAAGGEMIFPTASGEVFRYVNKDFLDKRISLRIFQTSDKQIFLTTEKELLHFDGAKLRVYDSSHGLTYLGRMAEDAAGNLWIGGRSGATRLDRKGLITYGEADGLNSTRLYTINESADGELYFANGDFVISHLKDGKFESIEPQIQPNARMIWTSRSAFLTRSGDWWILTHEKLYRFASLDKPPLATFDSRDGLKSDAMYQMYEDKRGNLWVSTRSTNPEGCGLARFNRAENKFEAVGEADGFPDGKAASAFAEDSQGNLWIGFYDGGLVRFDGEKFKNFSAAINLSSALVSDLLVDQKGRLWVSSAISGLLRTDDPTAENPVFTSLTSDQGLASNNIRTIVEDSDGRIYVGTARGVDRISPETMHIKHFSIADGLAADFVVDSYRDRSGALWFATANGLSRLLPEKEKNPAPPTVWLGGVRVSGLAQPVSPLGSETIEISALSHTQNNIQIDYFGLDFRPSETLRYQYKLEGADADWSQATEQRTVTYANLQPGTYRFLVRAVNSENFASEKPAVVSFKILSPIWARWWFIALFVFALCGFLFSLYRYRTARLREVNAALTEASRAEHELLVAREERIEELMRVRTRIATDLHDDIGASLTQISILSEVARQQTQKGNGAVGEPLKMISKVSNELVGTMSDIVWAINPNKDHLQDLILRMRRFASDVLSPKEITFEFDAPVSDGDIPLGANLRREVFLIFKESLNNIVKHSGASKVFIKFRLAGDFLSLQISDNGSGFDVEKMAFAPHLFSDEKGGNGIINMRKRSEEMAGNFEISSEIGKGTTIELRLPLEKKLSNEHQFTTQSDGDTT